VVDREKQPLGERDIRVSVKAISANPVDYKIASTLKDESSEPEVLGWDASGTVIEVGSKVRHYKVGDEVYYAGSIERPGSNTESQIVDELIVGLKPRSLTYKESAALPLTAITAWEAIFDQLHFPREGKKSVLILGAAGGVWLKPFGKVTSIVENRNPLELGLLKSKSLSFSWEFMFTRSMYQTPDMEEQRLILSEVGKLIDTGKIRTTLGLDLGDMNVSNIRKAHELLKSGKAIGKIVLGELKA
jgi:NADPH:quinone reductase-like Zn-dependent oxidoreductase